MLDNGAGLRTVRNSVFKKLSNFSKVSPVTHSYTFLYLCSGLCLTGLQNFSLPGHQITSKKSYSVGEVGCRLEFLFVKQVLNSEGNMAIGVKTILEKQEYKILILLWTSCDPLHLMIKREEKVSGNIF